MYDMLSMFSMYEPVKTQKMGVTFVGGCFGTQNVSTRLTACLCGFGCNLKNSSHLSKLDIQWLKGLAIGGGIRGSMSHGGCRSSQHDK